MLLLLVIVKARYSDNLSPVFGELRTLTAQKRGSYAWNQLLVGCVYRCWGGCCRHKGGNLDGYPQVAAPTRLAYSPHRAVGKGMAGM